MEGWQLRDASEYAVAFLEDITGFLAYADSISWDGKPMGRDPGLPPVP